MTTFLRVREASFLLQIPKMKVRRLVDSGELALVGAGTGSRRSSQNPDRSGVRAGDVSSEFQLRPPAPRDERGSHRRLADSATG